MVEQQPTRLRPFFTLSYLLEQFTKFMISLNLVISFNVTRAADVTGRGGLSFLELMLWAAALEPATQHTGIPAEIRCRYIFR